MTYAARLLPLIVSLAFAYLVFAPSPPPAVAGAIVVETEDDDFQVNGLCTLRDAIISANTDGNASGDCAQGSGADTIIVPADTYELDGSMFGGELVLTEEVEIVGAGADSTFIDGLDSIRILHVEDGVTATISGVTLRRGVDDTGAGIFNEGTLSLNDVIVTDNHANIDGGGLANAADAALTVTNSDISSNTAQTNGGGIANLDTLNVEDSNIDSNTAGGGGGGLRNEGSAVLSEVTLSGNNAGFGGAINNQATLDLSLAELDDNHALITGGGGILSDGTATVDRTSITNDTGDGGGGGYWSINDDATTITNSTIAGNSALVGGGMQAGGGAMSYGDQPDERDDFRERHRSFRGRWRRGHDKHPSHDDYRERGRQPVHGSRRCEHCEQRYLECGRIELQRCTGKLARQQPRGR